MIGSVARDAKRRAAALYLVFFFSGFSALLYQIAWQRILGLFAGSDAVAATIVVGAFLFGLGLGSLLAASFADRLSTRRAVQGFALCEVGIAAFALLSCWLFYDVFFGKLIALAASTPLVLVLVSIALLPPTMLMGISLPLLSKAVVNRMDTASSEIGRLYGVNTLGAGIGALVAGFFLIGAIGYALTIQLGAILNFIVGAVALLVAAALRDEAARSPGRPVPRSIRRVPALVWFWCLLVFLSGFIIISLEIVWFRVLGLLMQTNAYAFSLILAIFLVGDALGIFYGAWLVRRIAHPRRFFQWLQGAVASYALISLGLIWLGHEWLLLAPWFVDGTAYVNYPPFVSIALRMLVFAGISVVCVMPPAFLLGMSFPITQKAVQNEPALVGQRVGLIQLFNILGNTAGAVVTGLVLLHWLGTAGTLRIIGIAGLFFVAALLIERLPAGQPQGGRTDWWPAHAVLTAFLAILVCVFPRNDEFWSRLHGAATRAGAIVGEDRTGVAVLRTVRNAEVPWGGSVPVAYLLYIGGHTQSRVPFLTYHGALGGIGSLVHPEPRSILVIGHGSGGTPYASGINPLTERVRVIEIVQPVYDVMQAFARTDAGGTVRTLLGDPRFEYRVADARHVLFTDEARYDVIEADVIHPRTSHSGLLYSREFFQQMRDRLRPGGICVQWAATPRTITTFVSVFPHAVRIGETLLGATTPFMFDSKSVVERLRGSASAYVVAAGWDPDALAKLFTEPSVEIWTSDTPRPNDDVNTDLFPKDEFYLNSGKDQLLAALERARRR